MQLTYRMTGFEEHEVFRILINGVVQHSTSENTVAIPTSKYDDEKNGFVTIRSKLIQYGFNSIEFSVISHRENKNFKSKARVQIKKI